MHKMGQVKVSGVGGGCRSLYFRQRRLPVQVSVTRKTVACPRKYKKFIKIKE